MSTVRNARPVRATLAWLCTTFSVGCAATPLRPPPGDCPPEVVRSMEELGVMPDPRSMSVILDINQPGKANQEGIYRPGPIVSKVVTRDWSSNPLPEGTLLYGQLWMEGLTKEGRPAVLGRYTEALLPDGRRFAICFTVGMTGLIMVERDKPGEAKMSREEYALPVRYWP